MGSAGKTPNIYLASEEGNVEEVQRHVREGGRQCVDTPDGYGQCPLHYASVFGRDGVIAALLDAGAAVNCETANKTTPLHYAARNGQVRCVELLLARGAQVGLKDRDGWTPLHYACFRGHLRTAQVLLDKGAAVNDQNGQGHTPLHHACNKGFIDLACLLIAANADLTLPAKRGEPPLSFLPVAERPAVPFGARDEAAGAAALRTALLAMQRDGVHSDATLKTAAGTVLRAHRCMLAARSPALRDALAANPDVQEIEVKDAGDAAVRWFVEWMYSGAMPAALAERPIVPETVAAAIELLQLARHYAPAAEEIRSAVLPVIANSLNADVAKRLWAVIGADVDAFRPLSDHLLLWLIRQPVTSALRDLLEPIRTIPPARLSALLKDLPLKTVAPREGGAIPSQHAAGSVHTPVRGAVAAAPTSSASPPAAPATAPVATTTVAAAAAPLGLTPLPGVLLPVTPAPPPTTKIIPFKPTASCPENLRQTIEATNRALVQVLNLAPDPLVCRRICENLSKQKNSMWFRKPVDPYKDGLPQYYAIITEPMDIQTLRVSSLLHSPSPSLFIKLSGAQRRER
jgi:hypothetical protein